MTETLGYLTTKDGVPLYAAYHAPVDATGCPVLIVPPLLEERKSAYATLCAVARSLTAKGHPVLRFDFRGSGESGGEQSARRWSHLQSDLNTANQRLLELAGAPASIWLGTRMGATLCLQAAASNTPQAIVAIAPFAKGSTCTRHWTMRSKIRSEMTDEGSAKAESNQTGGNVLDLDGFEVASAFIEDCKAVNLLEGDKELPCPSLLVQVSHREEPSKESEKLRMAIGKACELSCIRMEPFWDRVDDVDAGPLGELIVAYVDRLSADGSAKNG